MGQKRILVVEDNLDNRRILVYRLKRLGDFEIIEASNGHSEVVELGVMVTIKEADFPPETYHLVGVNEADPRQGRISHESPFGKALLGHKKGDVVSATTPSGKIKLKILEIE